MSLNIVLDNGIILDLLSRSVNDTQHCFGRIRKPNIRFWIPACLLSLLETQINMPNHIPLSQLLNNEDVQLLSSLAANWSLLPARHRNRTQGLISLDAALLPGKTIIWTNQEQFETAEETIEWGDHEFLYGVLAESEYTNTIQLNNLLDQQLSIRGEIEYRLFNNLRHGQYILGPEVLALEKQLARFVGVKHCIGVGSGTDALLLSLLAADVSALDEVITSPFNFIAAAQMIAFIGAKPVFVDIDPETYNLDSNLLEAAITPQTRAIIPANLYGQCADYDSINGIAQTYRLMVIEDATQSFGARYKNRWSGSLASISCTGFTPSKALGAYGDAGACLTNDDLLADKLRRLRAHGQKERYHHELIGINSRLDNIQASILLAKLKIFPKEITARFDIGNRYTELLQGMVKTPFIQSYNQSCYSHYTIEVDERDLVRDQLAKRGIPTAVNYPLPLHLQPALSYLIQDKGSLPVAEATSKRVLSLPMDAYLTPDMQQEIVDAVKSAVKSF